MSSQVPMRRRAAALGILGSVLLRPWHRIQNAVALAIASAVADRAQGQSDNRKVLVQLYSPDDETLRRYLLHSRIEVLRYIPPPVSGAPASALALMPRSATVRARLPDRVNVEIVAVPPSTNADVPVVGRGNRFEDPNFQPQVRGQLIR